MNTKEVDSLIAQYEKWTRPIGQEKLEHPTFVPAAEYLRVLHEWKKEREKRVALMLKTNGQFVPGTDRVLPEKERGTSHHGEHSDCLTCDAIQRVVRAEIEKEEK